MNRIFALTMLMVGCESVESTDIKTSGIWADLSVSHAGNQGTFSTATATLRVGGPGSNTYVELVSGDDITVSVADLSVPMGEVALGDLIWYSATVEHTTGGDEWTMALTRAADEPAPSSTMALPADFDVDAIPGDLDASGSVVVTWAPSGTSDGMAVTVDGDCVLSERFDVSGDPGSFEVPGDQIQPTDEADAIDCDLTYTVERSRVGQVDPAYEGGTAVGMQSRSSDGGWVGSG
jgi:hypothetical protein